MKTQNETTMLRNIKKNVYSFYKSEDEKRKKHFATAELLKDQNQEQPVKYEIELNGELEIAEKVGRVFHWEEIYPPHEYALDDYNPGGAIKVKAKNLDGSESQFFRVFAESTKDSNEINLSLVLGQMFNTVYEGINLASGVSANIGHRIKFSAPLNRNIFIRSYTYAFIPDENEKYFHLDRGDAGIDEMGIECYLQTSLYFETNNDSIKSSSFRFKKFLDIKETNENRTEQTDSLPWVENILKIPAGTSEFTYSAGIRGLVYSSKDFSDLSSLQNDKHGFAMLDFRHSLKGSQTPILRDPLGAWDKQGFGGARLYIVLEFCEVESILTR